MKYLDSGTREPEQAVAQWMTEVSQSGPCEFRCQAGYFTIEGLGVLAKSLKEWSSSNRQVKLLIGSNAASTLASHIAYLAGWLAVPQDHVALGIVSLRNALFHPKVYHFVRADGSMCAYVGSANLTRQGIAGWNVEAGIVLDTNEGDDPELLRQIADNIDAWFQGEKGTVEHIGSADDVERLLNEGYLSLKRKKTDESVLSENEEQSSRASPAQMDSISSIFQMPSIPKLPEEGDKSKLAVPRSKSAKPVSYLRKTEASYHYPQGTHLGHILAVLKSLSEDRSKTAFADEFVRLDGSLGQGRIAAFRRQIKYKLLAAMEFGLVSDNRLVAPDQGYTLILSAAGENLWNLLSPLIDNSAIAFGNSDELSTQMPLSPREYNIMIKQARYQSKKVRALYDEIFLNVPAISQMLGLLKELGGNEVQKSDIYNNFFSFEAVLDFCDLKGIEPGTTESARHRCPLLLNILESADLIDQKPKTIRLKDTGNDE